MHNKALLLTICSLSLSNFRRARRYERQKNMRILMLLIGCLAFTSSRASSDVTECVIDSIHYQKLTWDIETMKAKSERETTGLFNDIVKGDVTLVRDHSEGRKINLEFKDKYIPDHFHEYIIFKAFEWRVVHVMYKVIDGKRYLTISQNNKAECI